MRLSPQAVSHPYGVRDVERLLGVPFSTIRALIAAGFVSPARGARNAWRFAFQDLIVLRTAQALVAARVPNRRITKSLKDLRRRLPESMPLSGLRIGAVGDRVVVKEGGRRWQAESGQYLLAFEGDPAKGKLSIVENKPAVTAPSGAEDDNVEARINMALSLHERGRLVEALRSYMEALEACGGHALLLFNLGVLLEDMNRKADAMEAYRGALRLDPRMADCHYNLALLFKESGRPKEAIRHMSQYRRLVGNKAT